MTSILYLWYVNNFIPLWFLWSSVMFHLFSWLVNIVEISEALAYQTWAISKVVSLLVFCQIAHFSIFFSFLTLACVYIDSKELSATIIRTLSLVWWTEIENKNKFNGCRTIYPWQTPHRLVATNLGFNPEHIQCDKNKRGPRGRENQLHIFLSPILR